MFLTTRVNLKRIPVGKQVVIEFPYSERVNFITKMISPCDCSLPYNIKEERKVIVKYTPKPVPEHLRLQGKSSYLADKTFTIYYVNMEGGEEIATVSFTATIIG